MKLRTLTVGFAALALFALSGVTASASTWNKKTYLTVNETIEVPGAILPPGEYVMKLVDSDSNRHIVQFLNSDEDEVLSTVIAIPNTRLHVTGDTEFAWYETPVGQPPAMRAWFFPGDNFGQEFAYPEGRASVLAQQSNRNVMESPAVPEKAENPVAVIRETEIVAVTPKQETQTDYEAAMNQNQQADKAKPYQPRTEPVRSREETQIAQAQPQQRPALRQQTARPEPAPQPVNEPAELPQTAGFGALFALIGFGSLGASAAIRKLRKS